MPGGARHNLGVKATSIKPQRPRCLLLSAGVAALSAVFRVLSGHKLYCLSGSDGHRNDAHVAIDRLSGSVNETYSSEEASVLFHFYELFVRGWSKIHVAGPQPSQNATDESQQARILDDIATPSLDRQTFFRFSASFSHVSFSHVSFPQESLSLGRQPLAPDQALSCSRGVLFAIRFFARQSTRRT